MLQMNLKTIQIDWNHPPLITPPKHSLHLTSPKDIKQLLQSFEIPLKTFVSFNQSNELRLMVSSQNTFLFRLFLSLEGTPSKEYVFLGESNAQGGLNLFINDKEQRTQIIKKWVTNDLKPWLAKRQFKYLWLEPVSDTSFYFFRSLGFVSKHGCYLELKLK
jgi:hypothetical protein